VTAWKHSGGLTRTGRSRWVARSGAIAWAAWRTPQRCFFLPGAVLVPDPFFIVMESLGRRYQVIAPAYPPLRSMADLVAGVTAILDAERIPAAYVVGSSFGGYVAQCLLRAHPERGKALALAQSGVRHFVGSAPLTVLRWLLQASPAPVVRWFTWRTWRVLLADIGPDQRFWRLLRSILERELSKKHLTAVMAAIADFTARYHPTADRSGRPVLVLQSERDRAFAAQAEVIRAAYPHATIRSYVGRDMALCSRIPSSTSVRFRLFWQPGQRAVRVPHHEGRTRCRPSASPRTQLAAQNSKSASPEGR
jgi:pimeloyl-ACP methyl ester carboxylesterase